MKTVLLTLALCASAVAQTRQNTPDPHDPQDPHAAGVDMRGDHAMGFSHETTTHHFTLLPDGGTIEVDANSENDDTTRDQIRIHLNHIASMFSANNFDVPMFIHDTVPPGVPTMKQKKAVISYTFSPTQGGGQVRITTKDPAAIKAVHDFLAFQIADHRTGEPILLLRAPSQ